MIAASNLVVKATRNYETIASDPAYRTKKKLPELTYFWRRYRNITTWNNNAPNDSFPLRSIFHELHSSDLERDNVEQLSAIQASKQKKNYYIWPFIDRDNVILLRADNKKWDKQCWARWWLSYRYNCSNNSKLVKTYFLNKKVNISKSRWPKISFSVVVVPLSSYWWLVRSRKAAICYPADRYNSPLQ